MYKKNKQRRARRAFRAFPNKLESEVISLRKVEDRSTEAVAIESAVTKRAVLAWVRQADVHDASTPSALTTDDREELLRLRRENERRLRQREVLSRLLWPLLGALGTALTFLFAYRFVMHHYVSGPYLWDSGWFSYSIFQKGFSLPNLPHFRGGYGESLLTQHIYGLVSVLTPLSHAFSTHYHYFSSVIGATYALMFLGPFLAVRALPASHATIAGAFIAFAVGLLFAGSGTVLAALGYPHFEVGIAGFFILFLSLHFLGFRRVKWLALLGGVLIREDAGLHYLGFATVIGLYQWWKKLEPLPPKTVRGMIIMPVGISLSMFLIQRLFFPIGSPLVHKFFVGDPPFAHVNAAELGVRLVNFGRDADHHYMPALLIVLASLALRTPLFALAYAPCIPWVLVNVVFNLNPAARTLSLYYGFPFLVGMAWPLFAPHWMTDSWRTRAGVPLVAAAALLSTYQLGNLHFPFGAAQAGGELSSSAFQRINECLKEEFVRSPMLYADSTVTALLPDSVPALRVHLAALEPPQTGVDGFIFFEKVNGLRYEQLAKQLGLEHTASIPHPALRILSRTASPFAECVGR